MLFWFLFLLFTFTLIWFSFSPKNSKINNISRIILVIWLIYFSGFRNSLGQDYESYKIRLGYFSNFELINWFEEPTFHIISLIINDTKLSYVFFFLVMSFITIIFLFSAFYKYPHSKYAILLFILSPGLGYIQTFNAIRQFAAISLFFYGCLFIIERKVLKYILFIFLGFLFHKSIIFLLPLYFFIDKRFNSIFMLLTLFISLVLPQVITSFFSALIFNIDDYSMYLQNIIYNENSFFFVGISILVAFSIIFQKKYFRTKTEIMIINMAFLCIVLLNLSVTNILFSRFALYLSPFLCLALCVPIKEIKYKYLYTLVIVSFFILVFFVNIYENLNNPLVVPNDPFILPLNSIFD